MTDATWLASPANNFFYWGPNWTGGVMPTDIAFFGASNTKGIRITDPTTLNTFDFVAGAPAYFFFVEDSLTLQGSGFVYESGAAAATVSISLNAVLAFDSAAPLTVSGFIEGSGTITQMGTGRTTLLAASPNFTGLTTVSAGILQLGSGVSLSPTISLKLFGGTFDLNGNNQTVGLIGGNAGRIALGTGTLTVNPSSPSIGETSYSIISGVGSLAKTGPGVLQLAASNTYSGGTTINGGAIGFTSADNFGTGAITLDGGGLKWFDNTIDMSSRLAPIGAGGATFDTFNPYNPHDITFNTALSGVGGIRKEGMGTLTLAVANS